VIGAVYIEAGPLSIEYDETGGPFSLVGVTVPYIMSDVPSKTMSMTPQMIGLTGKHTVEAQNHC
jgi:hypothetical protein